VHSTFSDGASSPEQNLASAAWHGLHTIGMVDHVRCDTTYLPEFAAEVRALDGTAGLRVLLGVEAKILDTAGTMDVPAAMPDLDYLLVADHQMPRPEGPMHPRAVREAIDAHLLDADQVIEDLVEATIASFGCYDRVILAHVFSILPKCGLSEDQVPERLVRRLGQAAAAADVVIEVNEKWACPSLRVVRLFADDGVHLTLSTDAHHEQRVGRYAYVAGVVEEVTSRLASQARR
jgi:putative hydrolase